MDDDDFRRGKKSSHVKFGEASNAILSGDALQALAYEVICDDKKLSSNNKIKAIKLISNACGKNGMVLGQHLDIESESKNLSIKAVENIHSLKTGKLIECSVMLGQINNNKNYRSSKIFEKIGLAFQITDDILEATSDQSILGKNSDSDTKNNKSTYIKVIGIEEAKKKSNKLSASAIKSLEELGLKETNILIELAKYISYRESELKIFKEIPIEKPITPLLDSINLPSVIRSFYMVELENLANEIREFLLYSVGQSGGHLGGGLGVIELTIILHYIFNTPFDNLIWDVGHQAYPHKILTGRKDQMHSIRKKGGLTPFPSRNESVTHLVLVTQTSISAVLEWQLDQRI